MVGIIRPPLLLYAISILGIIALGTPVGAVILRMACALIKKLSLGAVPEPTWKKALGIVFLALLASLMAAILLSFLTNSAIVVNGLASAVGLLTLAGLASVILPTTISKGLLVSILYVAVSVAVTLMIGVAFALIALTIMLVLRLSGVSG